MNEYTPKTLRGLPMEPMLRGELYAHADAWEAGQQILLATIGAADTTIGELRARIIEALEIKVAGWQTVAGPIWVGDESEGCFVCLVCNEKGADDGGPKTIRHLPGCEYAAALAAGEESE